MVNGRDRYSAWCLRSEDSIAHRMRVINLQSFGFLCPIYVYEPLGEIILFAKHPCICFDNINSTIKPHH